VSNKDPGARTNAALVVATMALLVATIGALQGRRDSPATGSVPAGAAASACVDKEARDEIEKLHRENATLREQLLGSLEGRVARLEGSTAAPPARRDGGAANAGATPVDGPPRYAKIVSPNPAITVRQDEGGGLTVKNTDPSLTGRTMLVDVTLEDGTPSKVRVVVPPP